VGQPFAALRGSTELLASFGCVTRLVSQLLLGEYGSGWRGWAKRNADQVADRSRLVQQVLLSRLKWRREWDGQAMRGCLLLNMQNGHGDHFVMARWIPWARERVRLLRLQVRPELLEFFRRPWPDVEVLSWHDDPGAFDRYCLSFSLPSLIRITEPEQVACAPYLKAMVSFRSLPGAFKVGLRWGRELWPYD
jgi:hypothetical protein